jgi:hypothetical protein
LMAGFSEHLHGRAPQHSRTTSNEDLHLPSLL